jgi:aryl-alcohol dehydrogenase-like predicted oxidoreductase
MGKIAEAHHVSVAQIALAWLLHQDYVTSVIIGVKTLEQLEDNIQAIELQLNQDELIQLDEVSKLPGEYPGWNQYPAWPSDRVPGDQ